MFNLRPPRWIIKSNPAKTTEDTHELLSEHEPTDRPIATWAQPRNNGVVNLLSHVTRKKVVYIVVAVGLVIGTVSLFQPEPVEEQPTPESRFPWENFRRLDGYYHGINQLVKPQDFVPQNGLEDNAPTPTQSARSEFELFAYQPLSSKRDQIQQCFLPPNNSIPAPDIYAFNGLPQRGVLPLFGSHDDLNLRSDVCFDRYGRYGPYGLGYEIDQGGTGLGIHGDQSLTKPVWKTSGHLNWSSFDLGDAQERCFERNQHRYPVIKKKGRDYIGSLAEFEDVDWQQYRPSSDKSNTIPRTAFVLRAWQGLEYKPAINLYIRSLVNELSLQSGGEYQVHILVEVKDTNRPIWTSKTAYDEVLAELVPEEFRSMATLWSQELMRLIYPGPFEPQFHDHGSMYPAMRSMHFALQWFMIQHPEYEYFWNWEFDIRYIGHWYELLNGVATWAKNQPRDHLWARNARFYIPSLYDNWEAFVHETKQKTPIDIISKSDFSSNPIPGDEEADFITFNPIFNPANTKWNRGTDVTGYDTSSPIPERRAAIVAASRHSRRLLLAMHYENYHNRHSMASEMFAPTMALHHGLKAVYVPLPVYFERDWPAEYASEIFNGGPEGDSGNFVDSVFGAGPKENYMALQQSTYYYEVQFAEFLWWRWLGYQDYRYDNEGGADDEMSKDRNGIRKGRMCLRSMLVHPVKNDEGRSI